VLNPSAGGTGLSTLTANNVILGNATGAVQFVAPGTNGNVLTSNGTTWTSSSAGAGTSGFSGVSGYSGTAGAGGTAGTSGFSGASGTSRYSGTSGFSGASGTSGFSHAQLLGYPCYLLKTVNNSVRQAQQ